jgi:gas vesicle protein
MSRKDHQRQSQTLKRIAIGGTIAAAAGYIAGVLTAPKSGKETRHDIKAAADRGRQEAEKDLKRLHTELDAVLKQAKGKSKKLSKTAEKEYTDLVEKAQDTKEKAREMLSAIHEGDAEDQDLKRAIKDANKALEHLRDFIKK